VVHAEPPVDLEAQADRVAVADTELAASNARRVRAEQEAELRRLVEADVKAGAEAKVEQLRQMTIQLESVRQAKEGILHCNKTSATSMPYLIAYSYVTATPLQ
jgi:hypothetical protein